MKNSIFSSIKIGSMDVKNRIFMSPMCQYSAKEGLVSEWHKIHYVSRAVGGVGAIVIEATAVEPNGRISPYDLGIWSNKQKIELRNLVRLIKEHNCKVGLQLAHAGRKGSKDAPWRGSRTLNYKNGGWDIIAPSPIAFDNNSKTPKQMDNFDIKNIVEHFKNAATNAIEAGFDFLEVHMAHGYLLHEFLSELSNKREDEYGGSFDNRCRFPLLVVKTVKSVMPESMPLFVRISATDWVEGGWEIEQSVKLVKRLKAIGVDFIDVSSGGLTPDTQVVQNYGFQTGFAERIKKETGVLTGTVGMIVNPYQAEHIISSNQADVVFLGRALLHDPYWVLHAARLLNHEAEPPNQYMRAKFLF